MLEHKLQEAIEAVINVNDRNKYNVALGFFDGYSTVDNDKYGTRFANIKLHYRDAKGKDIDANAVPLFYSGSKDTVDEFGLDTGDEMIVLFSDRTLEKWVANETPQVMSNSIKDSKNHALAIPVSSHHSIGDITAAAIDATVGRRILVKAGKKIQIGTDVDELLKILHSMFSIIKTWNGGTAPWAGSTLDALVTQLGNITKTT
jgi:ABC-type xylose transport system substrate-binding protein